MVGWWSRRASDPGRVSGDLRAAVALALLGPLLVGGCLLPGGSGGPTPTGPSTGTLMFAPGSASPSTLVGSRPVGPGLPDPALTPGAVDPAVTQANIGGTICRTGYTTTVRPPVEYTGALKRQQIVEYGYTDTDPRSYEEDHLIPLGVGGAPRDPANLWPEPLHLVRADGTDVGAYAKDGLEGELRDRICSGAMTLAAAQAAFARDWVAAWEAAGRP